MDAYDIGQAFADIENELIDSMMRNMKRHRLEEDAEKKEWTMWQAMQLEALERYKKANKKRFAGKFQDINDSVEDIIKEARAQGRMDQEIEILEQIKNGFQDYDRTGADLMGEFFKLNDRKLGALIQATQNDFQKGEQAILRMTEDQYRQTIFSAQVYANTGAGTYEKAVDMATKDFLSRGINCIQYANGTRHTMRDYADMAIKTANKRAYLAGEGEKRAEWGIHTVIVNKRGNPCPKCAPFCGKVLIDDVYSGGSRKDGKYPLLSRAMALGLYHPRCKDSHTTYFPGISTADDKWTKKELEVIGEDYQQEQRQQHAERQSEKFERLAKYSLDEENRSRYRAKANEWGKYVVGESIRGDRTTKYSGKSFENSFDSDIIKSGARITDLFSEVAENFAKMYYAEIRSFTTDAKKIADNLGKNESDIKKIKEYLFENNSLFDVDAGEWRKFDPDCAIAQSWQRLMSGKNIQQHDRTLIEHELLEMKIKEENPKIGHQEAHELASKRYDYGKEALEYYGNLEKHKKNRK